MKMDVEETVRERYSEGAKQRQASLCCPVDYDAALLSILPGEIIEKDYGCGDPSRYAREGDKVLDLGSGAGKICYMAAQLVGESGHVMGIDVNDDMLALARRYQPEIAQRLGSDRVSFRKGHIQDLALDLEALDAWLDAHPVASVHDHAQLRNWEKQQRLQEPLVGDASIDLVISNCVLNLVDDAEKQQLISEVFRVLKPGGRIAISDIVSDREIPEHMKSDPALWSGCVSGAFHENAFLEAFSAAGFSGVCYDRWDDQPWQVIEGIAFRSVTVTACKPLARHSANRRGALLYRGPFAEVMDDAGNRYVRGRRVTVGAEAHGLATSGIFGDAFIDLDTEEGQCDAGAGCCTPGPGKKSDGCC